jgi:cytochrome c oxidase subunit 1
LYPTLLCSDFHSSCAVDFLIFCIHLLGFSSILNSLNVVGTLFAVRRRFFVFCYLSLFLSSLLLTSLLLLVVLPVLAGAVTLCLFDRNFNTCYFDIIGGGDLVLFQHLFWFFGHPEVYVIILPVFGFISTLCEFCTLRLVFGYTAMLYSLFSISCVGYFVWAHHSLRLGWIWIRVCILVL